MAAPKTAPTRAIESSPEQIALTEASAELERCVAAERDSLATLGHLRDVLDPRREHTSPRPSVQGIRPITPGSGVGVMRTIESVPAKTYPTPSPLDFLRARTERPAAEARALEAAAATLEARRTVDAARLALARREFREALPALTADMDRLLRAAEALAAEADAVFTARIGPLLATNALAGAVAECRLTELELLRERSPQLRALLAALTDQYGGETNGQPR